MNKKKVFIIINMSYITKTTHYTPLSNLPIKEKIRLTGDEQFKYELEDLKRKLNKNGGRKRKSIKKSKKRKSRKRTKISFKKKQRRYSRKH